MENFVALIIIAAFLSAVGIMVIRNVRSGAVACGKTKAVSVVLLVSALLILCDASAGNGVLLRLPFDMLLSIIAVFSLNSSVVTQRESMAVAVTVCLAEICMSVYYLLCMLAGLPLPSGTAMMAASAMAAVLMAVTFVYGVSCRIRNISSLMTTGNVWDWFCLSVDAVYVAVFLSETVVMLVVFRAMDSEYSLPMSVFPVLFGTGQIALGIRAYRNSPVVLARRHEQRIAGALKVPKEPDVTKHSSASETYREIYSRVVMYFEEEKPYLNGDLTINDVVKGVYTNKLYISKAISQCAGKNFCQFVNYYRVMYSIESYRINPEMRVADMWQTSGFNSIVSYNMAFKLFMGENPSDWCRKEKSRLAKCKK